MLKFQKVFSAGDSVIVTGVLFAKDKKPVKVRKILALQDVGEE
jgi:hypothetical protein